MAQAPSLTALSVCSILSPISGMKKQLDSKWKQLDHFEASVRKVELVKTQWRNKLSQKQGELESLQAKHADVAAQLNEMKGTARAESTNDSKSSNTRISTLERRLNNAMNQIATYEEKLNSARSKMSTAESRWDVRVKEYESRLKAAEEKVKAEKQGGKERAAQLDMQVEQVQLSQSVCCRRILVLTASTLRRLLNTGTSKNRSTSPSVAQKSYKASSLRHPRSPVDSVLRAPLPSLILPLHPLPSLARSLLLSLVPLACLFSCTVPLIHLGACASWGFCNISITNLYRLMVATVSCWRGVFRLKRARDLLLQLQSKNHPASVQIFGTTTGRRGKRTHVTTQGQVGPRRARQQLFQRRRVLLLQLCDAPHARLFRHRLISALQQLDIANVVRPDGGEHVFRKHQS